MVTGGKGSAQPVRTPGLPAAICNRPLTPVLVRPTMALGEPRHAPRLETRATLGVVMQNDTGQPRGAAAGDGIHAGKPSIWISPVNIGVLMGILLVCLIAPGPWAAIDEQRMLDATAACLKHQRALSDAILAYARDHGERYPPARDWCDRVRPYVKDPKAFVCPAAGNRQCSYAFNAELSELPVARLVEARRVVMLFESDRGWNAAGDQSLLVQLERHRYQDDIWTLASGSVYLIARNDPWHLRWRPGLKPAARTGAGSAFR